MPAKTLMVMGTSSSVGKSLLVAALCRIFAREGRRVAPFKAQNMSNNASVCADGAEIGRAQAVQARACCIQPVADMNPVLLKPEGQARSQVIVLGKPWETMHASGFYQRKKTLWPIVTSALDRLRQAHDLVVIEGAGSPVELNLKSSDIVNMAVARHADSPVLLVGDIDRGGIFAQLLGTLWLLPADERALIRGLIVNKFRGDLDLFTDGVRILQERAAVPVLGVVPFVADVAIPEEDAVALDEVVSPDRPNDVDIAILRLPHIANFDDFDAIARERGVRVRYVQTAAELGHPGAIIVPGTKSTMTDLAWLRERGLDRALTRLEKEGAAVVGICGGFQMLGQTIHDPEQVESDERRMPGLGLLPVETTFERAKITRQVTCRVMDGPGWLQSVKGLKLDGYEIHMGRTLGGRPWLDFESRDSPEGHEGGAIGPDGRIWGCYLHGLFANSTFRRAWLNSLRARANLEEVGAVAAPHMCDLDAALDRLAGVVAGSIDMKRLHDILNDC